MRANEVCGTCRYFAAREREPDMLAEGQCRRNPPTIAGLWPDVCGQDWCGEWDEQPTGLAALKSWPDRVGKGVHITAEKWDEWEKGPK